MMQEGTLLSVSHTAVTDPLTRMRELLAVDPRPVLLEPCPIRDVLDRIGDKWSVLVITLLGDGPMRFNELKRTIDLVSQRMLTRTLRGLERDGLIIRTVYPVVPPRVEYDLTETGQELQGLLRQLAQWAFQHADGVAEARLAYDERSPSETSQPH